MTHADTASCREAAGRCRRLAAEANDPLEKQELQNIADGWLTLPQARAVILALKQLSILR
jgi:hypothetical protein